MSVFLKYALSLEVYKSKDSKQTSLLLRPICVFLVRHLGCFLAIFVDFRPSF